MTCSACSSRIEKALSKFASDVIQKYSVNLLTNSMLVSFEDSKINENEIIKCVEKAGYGASVRLNGLNNEKDLNNLNNLNNSINKDLDKDLDKDKDLEDFYFRLKISFLFLVPLMYISMGHMLDIKLPAFLTGHKNAIAFSLTQFLLTIPICYVNKKYFTHGFKALFKGSPNMDSLIALGASSALIYSIFAIYRIGYGLGISDMELVSRYHMDLYFESCAMILALITLGKFLETKSKKKTSEALNKLIDLAPKTALVEVSIINSLTGEQEIQEIEKDCNELIIGDIIIIKPGSSVPVDGEIIFGNTFVDQSAITGESIPIEKNIGDFVIGATINKNGFIKIKATKIGADTMFSQIIALVEEASSTKAPIAKLADKISGIFVPIVIFLSILTSIIWLIMGYSFETSLSFAITVLVISCPCALGLATPLAIMVGTGKGAEHGILVKSGEALEIAHNINTIILDKTGTITQGKPEVIDILAFGCTNQELIQIAFSLEKQSEHPLGQAIYEYGKEFYNNNNNQELNIIDFEAVTGRGVKGKYNNIVYYGGNEAFLKECNIDFSKYKQEIDKLAEVGKAPLLFANQDKFLGIISVADKIKIGSKDAISKLKQLDLEVFMVTGDNKKTANFIANDLKLDGVIAEVLPQDKENIVKEYQSKGKKVAMVGDGINDAPALMRADIGIAMANGTDIAIESGDIILMNDDLNSVVTAINLSKKVLVNIKQNLFWAFFYNCMGIPLAMGLFYIPFGLKLTPMYGAMAMSFSSLFVVLNALRLRNFKGENISYLDNLDFNNNFNNNREELKNMIILNINGMMCQHCVKHVTNALSNLDEISEVNIELEKNQATVNTIESITNLNNLIDLIKLKIEDAGYELVSHEVR